MVANETQRELAGDKAVRIVDAMRTSVARRGVAGSTFDHVAREAGVSRGLLHYYFGSKERLLVEVAKHDSRVRATAMAERLSEVGSVDDLVSWWTRSLRATVRHEPEFVLLLLELFSLSQRNPDIASETSGMTGRTAAAMGARLARLRDEGRIDFDGEPDTLATTLLGFTHGLALQLLSNSEASLTAVTETASAAIRSLVREPA